MARTNMKWTFRPSALVLCNYAARESRKALVHQYHTDNARAISDGVSIPPRPTSSSPGLIRTLQWNVQGFVTAEKEKSSAVTQGIVETILQADADVIVLNEYQWEDKDARHVGFEKQLRERGYQCWTARIFCPTFLASRLYLYRKNDDDDAKNNDATMEEIRLSDERSALVVHVQDPATLKWVQIVGTHLDYQDGWLRKQEMCNLLAALAHRHAKWDDGDGDSRVYGPTIIMGDLNQQRQQDYSAEEWKKITEGMDYRRALHDDGVATLLQEAGFVCAWDYAAIHNSNCNNNNNTVNVDVVHTNWETTHPPSTHWSGTIVDYSYGNSPYVEARGVYISPSGFSDHRMTVCDWKIHSPTKACSTVSTSAAAATTTTTTTKTEQEPPDWSES